MVMVSEVQLKRAEKSRNTHSNYPPAQSQPVQRPVLVVVRKNVVFCEIERHAAGHGCFLKISERNFNRQLKDN